MYAKDSVLLNVGYALDGSELPHQGTLRRAVVIWTMVKLLVGAPFFVEPVCDVAQQAICRKCSAGVPIYLLRAIVMGMAFAVAVFARDQLSALCELSGCLIATGSNIIIPLLCYAGMKVGNGMSCWLRCLIMCVLTLTIFIGSYGTVSAARSLMSCNGAASFTRN
jgi:hypothetical protein